MYKRQPGACAAQAGGDGQPRRVGGVLLQTARQRQQFRRGRARTARIHRGPLQHLLGDEDGEAGPAPLAQPVPPVARGGDQPQPPQRPLGGQVRGQQVQHPQPFPLRVRAGGEEGRRIGLDAAGRRGRDHRQHGQVPQPERGAYGARAEGGQ